MQLSEVFRIGIVVPLTGETKQQLSNARIIGLLDVKFLPLTQEDFSLLWHLGIFGELSVVLNERIVDYEEICIKPEKLSVSLKILNKYLKIKNDDMTNSLLRSIQDILLTAIDIFMPVYFIF